MATAWQKIPRAFARMISRDCDGLESRIVWWMLGRVQVRYSRGKVRIPGETTIRQTVKGEIVTSSAVIGRDLGASDRSVRRRLKTLDRFSWMRVRGSRGFTGLQGGTLITLDLDAIESYEIGQQRRSLPNRPALVSKQTGNGDQTDRTPAPISVDVPPSGGASALQARAAPGESDVRRSNPTGQGLTDETKQQGQARRPEGARPTDTAEAAPNGMASAVRPQPPTAPAKAGPTKADCQARQDSLLAEIAKRKDKSTAAAQLQGTTDKATTPGGVDFPKHETDGQGKGLPPDDDVPF